ncbi:site-specific DNA-methyltransferase [uncultured Dysosmobacter sp.]|uniref:site-specific DNA-methyltransferase n=1 Tax=uncultured Dysosmobacter sp. TaxID=2591384 RepID=UPI00261041F8|nr:site-specific DNA-methyltransferase [uncultured Dysosmobacter sp.]
MDNLKMHTPDLAEENYKKLAAMFPNAVTETINEDGEVVRAIDADVLRQEISAAVVEGTQERYQFTWPDKKKSVVLANQPIAKTLRLVREKSVGRDGTPGSIDTENIYIEGDNLDALKLLQETYLGQVKLIYIDPPYNTGSDVFVYDDDRSISNDDFSERSGQYDDRGSILFDIRQNNESNGRFHTDWLNMLYPRLRIAKDFLSYDGVIFISIDAHELENLIKICNEIFGESNQQAVVTYVRKTSGKQDSSNFMNSTEYILVYSKSDAWDCSPLVAESNVTNRYNKEDSEGRKYRETDLRKTGSGDRREDRPLMWYPFYFNPTTNDLLVREQEDSGLIAAGYKEIWPIKPDNSEGRWRWGFSTATRNIQFLIARIMPKYASGEKYTVYEKDYIDKKGEVRTVKEHTSWDRTEFNSDNAMQEFKKLGFSNQLFPFPKSSALMKHIVYLANCQDCIVMDFFSGSGTFAEGTLRLNSEDNGGRHFILVQLPEVCEESSDAYKAGFSTICDIGEERIRRAGKKIKEETSTDIDYGFRVFRVDTTNMEDVYYRPADYNQGQLQLFANNIKADRTSEDLLFQVMLDLGILLSSEIEETEIAGKKVFIVGGRYETLNGEICTHLVACFDTDITEITVTEIAKLHPSYAVFRDSGIASDSVMTNFEQIFETYSPKTQRKVL